jgi:hypothetical protein
MTAKQMHQYTYRLAAPESEFCPEFVQGMANRMAVSFHKYGRVKRGAQTMDTLGSLQLRLDTYLRTGNTEYLMDVANFCMIEFMHPRHPEAHFEATDSKGSPGRVRVINGKIDQGRN